MTRDLRAPLKIGFNARLLDQADLRGWNRYAINLLEALSERGVELYLYSERPVHPSHLDRLPTDRVHLRREEGLRLPVWEHRWLPTQCRADGIDALHSPFNFGLPWSCPCPTVLTLHDAIDFLFHRARQSWTEKLRPGALRMWAYHWIARTRADRVITVSHHAAGDLKSALGVPESKLSVIHEAADPIFHRPVAAADRERARTRHHLPARYFFYVGGWEERKNIPFLLRAFHSARSRLENVHLVLAGGRGSARAEVLELADELGIADAVRPLGWVEEEDLPALYAEAVAFVYPSRYEGFGLQLCEAMAVGCPALASNATSLPEVLGEGGATFALDDLEGLADLLARTARDEGFRRDLVERARRRSADFSWRKTAEETIEVYRSLIKAGK